MLKSKSKSASSLCSFISHASLLIFLLISVKALSYDAAIENWQSELEGLKTWKVENNVVESTENSAPLATDIFYGDSIVKIKYAIPENGNAKLLFLGRYGFELNGELSKADPEGVHEVELWFRSPQFNEAQTKLEDATILKVMVDKHLVNENISFSKLDRDSTFDYEQPYGKNLLLAGKSKVKVFYFSAQRADFTAVSVPEKHGTKNNISELEDSVALGKQYFTDFGCAECHSVSADDNAVKSGPNIFGLFQIFPQERNVVEGGEKHKFTVKADFQYLLSSVREPKYQLATGRSGMFKDKAFPPIMPAFDEKVMTNKQIIEIFDYLQTLNEPANRGPVYKLQAKSGPKEYNPLEDEYLFLVGDRTRIQRGPMQGTSARAIHVGQTNGVNYSFDPRNFAVVKIWQGGFLNVAGELQNRGGRGLEPGFKARDIRFGGDDFLLAPLDKKGGLVDFGFKDARFRDHEAMDKSLNSKLDQRTMVAQVDAQFLGYNLDSKQKDAVPEFSYRVEKNTIRISFDLSPEGEARFKISGNIEKPQKFKLNTKVLGFVEVDVGSVEKKIWTIPAGSKVANLKARVHTSETPWFAGKSDFNYLNQKLETRAESDETVLPLGYSVEDFVSPKDNFGRDQLFEAMGLAQAKDGAIVVATRTAGIWRLQNNTWKRFAEGTFDALGVVIEDDKGLVLTVGQKPELTRIADTNGDGLADSFQTLFDAFSYHGNYHAYLHGPLKTPEGKYLINLNLVHDDAAYKAGGKYMGTFGGYRGWAILVDENKNYELLASGLRSPAGLGISPDGRLWYTDNQGEYLGTSKLFSLQKNAFYSHPAGLIDKPGMQPNSSEIQWKKIKGKRTPASILFPHNRLANSPGHVLWDDTEGKFGAFTGQAFVGDQTQSTLMRIDLEKIDGVDQGAIIPFASKLGSGVMRPLFLQDGSLLLGQTGRGWRAQGGQVASLQKLIWDGSTPPNEISDVKIQENGFKINFTNIVNALDESAITIESWRYRDAPDYGSPELDLRNEEIKNMVLGSDGKSIYIEITKQKNKEVDPQQTARIYHLQFNRYKVFSDTGGRGLDAYYTVNKWPKTNQGSSD